MSGTHTFALMEVSAATFVDGHLDMHGIALTEEDADTFSIDKDVPLPPSLPTGLSSKGRWQVLLKEMEVGDSVGGLNESQRRAVYGRAKKMDFNVTMRKEGDKYRVWKMADKGD